MKIITAALALLVLASSEHANAAPWGDAEHILYVRLESEPTDATVLSIPAGTNATPAVIGRTPMVFPIEMSWGRRFFMKSWSRLAVDTLGDVATNEYEKASKDQVVWLTVALEKPGYLRQNVQEIVSILPYARSQSWEDMLRDLPENMTLTCRLVAATAGTPTASVSPSTIAPTVMVASGHGGQSDQLGVLAISGPEGAPVVVDGVPVGKAPVRLLLTAGEHAVQTLVQGKPGSVQRITVAGGATVSTELAEAASP